MMQIYANDTGFEKTGHNDLKALKPQLIKDAAKSPTIIRRRRKFIKNFVREKSQLYFISDIFAS